MNDKSNIKEMIIDTEFQVGDTAYYLSGDTIYHAFVNKITIESSLADKSFIMVYELSDGLRVPRNNYPKWDKRLFKDKKSLLNYLSKQE